MKKPAKRLRLLRPAALFHGYLNRVCDACGIVPPVAAAVAVKL